MPVSNKRIKIKLEYINDLIESITHEQKTANEYHGNASDLETYSDDCMATLNEVALALELAEAALKTFN